MCDGSSRVSQGGSIAILRPISPQEPETNTELRLLFSNNAQALLGCGGTKVEFQDWEDKFSLIQCNRSWVIIHRDGDLTTRTASSLEHNAFFCFSLDGNSAPIVQLPQTLNLGVGSAGIIGRRVSLITSSRAGPETVAEGIIGWN